MRNKGFASRNNLYHNCGFGAKKSFLGISFILLAKRNLDNEKHDTFFNEIDSQDILGEVN